MSMWILWRDHTHGATKVIDTLYKLVMEICRPLDPCFNGRWACELRGQWRPRWLLLRPCMNLSYLQFILYIYTTYNKFSNSFNDGWKNLYRWNISFHTLRRLLWKRSGLSRFGRKYFGDIVAFAAMSSLFTAHFMRRIIIRCMSSSKLHSTSSFLYKNGDTTLSV